MSAPAGLQPERTSMAWTRTALSAGALAGTLVKVAADERSTIDYVCAAVAAAAGLMIYACGRSRALHAGLAPSVPRRLVVLAMAAALVANLAALVVIVGHRV